MKPADLVIAVDLGATQIRAAVVSSDGEIVRKATEKTAQDGTSGLVVTGQIIELIDLLTSSPERGHPEVAAIGISSAGPIDRREGSVVQSPNMVFSTIPLKKPLQDHFRLPVVLLNDGTAGALGEYWCGAARGCDFLVYITLSTGIGGGVIQHGSPLLGRGGNAAEFGHFSVDNRFNLPCHCGNRGHWEAYASGKNLPSFFAAWVKSRDAGSLESNLETPESIFDAAYRQDPRALAFIDVLSRINARALSTIIAAYDPEVIILDGPIARQHGEIIMEGFLQYLDRYLPTPEIQISVLGGNSPLLGAAWCGLGKCNDIRVRLA